MKPPRKIVETIKMKPLPDEMIKFLVQEIRGKGKKTAEKLGIDADNIYYEAAEELFEKSPAFIKEIAEDAHVEETVKEDDDPTYDPWRHKMSRKINYQWY